jgi:cathepsin B
MQQEILTNGPIVGEIVVHTDFKKYKGTSVYIHKSGVNSGMGHAIKIVGWGMDKGVPYWTIINSWGKWW